jgi:putative toxin-antitoxin system antitoxin component (TIGR02293 family)
MSAEGATVTAEAGAAAPASTGSRVWLTGQKLGGEEVLGVAVRSESDFVKVVERGVPLASLTALSRQEGLSLEEIDRLIIPRRTLAHRKARQQPLNRAESERAVRVASLTALAEETFANQAKAQTWLRRPTSALGDKRPLDLLDSEPGARLVEQLLYRIAHGIAA